MKLLTFLTIVLLVSLSVHSVQAQIPQKFNYQAIVRDNAGTVIVSKPLGMRFSIRDGSATGAVQYSETQLTTTNAYGLVNLQVGAGTVATGSFAAITWAGGNKFLQVEIDTTGSANYVSLATVELIAVPYALQAQQAAQSQQASHAAAADSAGKSATAKIADSARRTRIADSAIASGKATLADSAAKIATGQVVKAINGLKDNVTLTVGGGNTLTSTGNNITITGTSGTITGVNSPLSGTSGLSGGGTSGNVNLSVIYAGSGNTV